MVVTVKKLRLDLVFRYFVAIFRRIPGIICVKCKTVYTSWRQDRLKGLLSLLKIWQAGKKMNYQNDDLRIKEINELLPPVALLEKFPATENAANTVSHARKAIHKILKGNDDRLLVVIGPCSIHDPAAAKEYAARLLTLREELKGELEIVMRVYFEKPRTTVGWKGLINDPHMDNSFQINDGLRIARKLLLEINDSGLPAAGEFLDMITPQYLADLMSWGAIGARTTESQVHRELASGLSCPVGLKTAPTAPSRWLSTPSTQRARRTASCP
jgi:phospho-2-dehydro-3-deoxyheptonate aldolase